MAKSFQVIIFYTALTFATNVTSQITLPVEIYPGRITLSPHWSMSSQHYYMANSRTHHRIVTWKFEITVHNYNDDGPHPYVFFHNHEQSHVYIHYGSCIGNTRTLEIFELRDPRLLRLKLDRRAPCIKLDSKLVCSGEIKVAAAYPVQYRAFAAFPCPTDGHDPPSRTQLDVSFNVTIKPYETVTCLETSDALSTMRLSSNIQPYLDLFKTYYEKYSEWNLLGLTEIDIKEQADYFPFLSEYDCYKYLFELLFRIALPECVNGQMIYQCSEMCEDFRTACGNSGGVLLSYSLGCANLASRISPYPCVYKTVTCDEDFNPLENGYMNMPENRTVDSEIEFYCNDGYNLYGNKTAVCGWSGSWEVLETPTCRKQAETTEHIAVIIALSVVGGLALFILALSFYVYGRYRHEVFILICKYLRCLLCCSRFQNSEEQKLYDAFVAYHEDDENFVKNMQEKLEANGYKLYVEYRDGRLGEPPLRYIPEAIAHSHRVIIILSKSFLEDRMCEYMLDQAFYQTLEGETFKVIIVLMQEQKTINNKIPRFLKGFLRTGDCVQKSDSMFCTKIKHAMPPLRNNADSSSNTVSNRETDQNEIELESDVADEDEIQITVDA